MQNIIRMSIHPKTPQSEKTIYKLGENTCNSHNGQMVSIKKKQRILTNQQEHTHIHTQEQGIERQYFIEKTHKKLMNT